MSVKVFDCVPVVDSIRNEDDRDNFKIDCMECCGRDLYLGTNDSQILSYLLDEKFQDNGKLSITGNKSHSKNIGTKKPIKCIKAASAISRLMVLCDSNLYVLKTPELDVLGGSPQLKGVATFCVNGSPDSPNILATQICVARQKCKIQVFNVTDEKFDHIKDIDLDEPAQQVAMFGSHICAALATQYAAFNLSSNSYTSQQLFTYANEHLTPIICNISQDEFLVSAHEDLGMFVTTAGMSHRPPIQWSNPPRSITYYHPFIIGLNEEVIMVYSIYDQQLKHTLQIVDGRFVGNFDGRIYASSSFSVYNLSPVPWEKQVEVLLSDLKVDEALAVAQNSNIGSMSKDVFMNKLKKIQQRAGFIYFSNCEFEKAREMFETGKVDIKELIAVFPGLLPVTTNFVRAVPPLHSIADVVQTFHHESMKINEAKQFLLCYLRDFRHNLNDSRLEVDTALLKLYAELLPSELEEFIVFGDIICDTKDCCSYLEKFHCYHALALLYRHAHDNEKALKIWSKIISGELTDESFHGLQFFIECVANLKEHELIWRYADFVLSQNEELGVQIFTSCSRDIGDEMKPDMVVDFLYRYPKAIVKYLENLVLERNIQVEKFHTQLAVLYLENILLFRNEGKEDLVLEYRKKIKHLLHKSNLCRVQLILGKMQTAELHEETAILYGKVGQHGKALHILVNDLEDFRAAESYCINTTKEKDLDYKHHVFHTLLDIYLNPELSLEKRQIYLDNALKLLNAHAADFDVAKVLKVIPPESSLARIEPFLRMGFRTSLHRFRMKKMESSLARGDNLRKWFTLHDQQSQSIVLRTNSFCCVCKKIFTDGRFAWYPNNVIAHIECAKDQHICPLTGRNFKTFGGYITNR